MINKTNSKIFKERRIILASQSPRRIALLKEWGLKFEVCPSNIDETTNLIKPSYIVKDLSYKKGIYISKLNPNSLILSSDTIVVLNKKIVGKPKNAKESERIIRELNGSVHKVYTGVSIIDNASGKCSIFYDIATIKMKQLPENDLRKLFGKHLDKAGSYSVQDMNDNFVEKIYGDYYTVVGLPHIKLIKELKKYKIYIR
jgi:septum formation protein